MCGIAGFHGLGPGALSGRSRAELIERMLGAMEHRGPDEFGVRVAGDAALGTARLSIVDLAGGVQPMHDPESGFTIAFNGELYDHVEIRAELAALGHRFRTRSDTEVVLRALIEWGERALSRFDGGYSFALLQERTGRLVLARDPWGKRPLYTARREDGALFFASSIRGLRAAPGLSFELDPARLARIFTAWTPLPGETAWRGVDQVEPGSWVELEGARSVARTPFGPFLGLDAPGLGVPEAQAEIRRLFAGSVRRRLRADVEVGCYLSGGVDSAIVTHLAREEVGARLRTYSVEFDDPEFDESADQRRLQAHFGTRHRSVRISHQDIVESFPAALSHAEVPVFRTAFVPMFLLSRAVRDDGLRVVLTGEGADEAFLGYDIFKETWLRRRWGSLGGAERKERLRALYPYLPHFTEENAAALAAHFDRLAAEPASAISSHALRFRNGAWAAGFLDTGADAASPEAEIAEWAAAATAPRPLSSIAQAQWLEFRTLLHGYLLSTQGDRMALAHGVENRCPFLAQDVVRFAGSLPEEWRLAGGSEEKRILRDAFRGALPEWVREKRKRPYRAPDAAAFFGADRPAYLDAALSPAELARVPCLRAERVEKLVEKLGRTPADKISPKESQAFLLILSTCLLAREEHPQPAAPRRARRVEPTVLRDLAVETA